MPFDETFAKEFIKRLEEAVKRKTGSTAMHCPLCSNNNWSVQTGYMFASLQTEISSGITLGVPGLPTVPIVCNNCGFVAQIALGSLGLLPTPAGRGEART